MPTSVSTTVQVVTTSSGFAVLEEEWDDLHRHAPDAFPYDSWAFLFSWWESYGHDRTLRLIVVRDTATRLLVGVVPLMVERRRHLRTLLCLAGDEPSDIVVRDGWGPVVEAAVTRALPAVPGWDLAELRTVRPGARLWRVYDAWRGPREHVAVADYPHVAARDEDEVMASLSRNHRSTVRRSLRRAESAGLESRPVPAGQATEAGRRLVALHHELFEGRALSDAHASEQFGPFLTALSTRLTARGLGVVVEWVRDGEVEISVLFLYGPAAVHVYQVGASRYAIDHLQWSSVFVWGGLAIARDRAIPELDLAPGDEQYKARWSSSQVPYHRLRLGNGMRGRMFFALKRIRAGVAHRVRPVPAAPAPAEGAPGT